MQLSLMMVLFYLIYCTVLRQSLALGDLLTRLHLLLFSVYMEMTHGKQPHLLGGVYTPPSLEVKLRNDAKLMIRYIERSQRGTFFLRAMLHTLAKAEREKKPQKQTDLSFWSYWSICRVCVPVRYPLYSVWFSGQWVDALHSHRSVAGWCPGRFLCEPTRQRERERCV